MIIRFKLKSLDIYTCVVKVDRKREVFELDVYLGDPYFRDGTMKWLGEAQWIGGYEDYEFDYPTRPIDLAKEIVSQWEMPLKLERYLTMQGHFVHMKDKPPKEEKPKIYDYEEIEEQNYIEYLMNNPHEIDLLDKQERKKLFKQYPDLKARYQEWLWLEREAQ